MSKEQPKNQSKIKSKVRELAERQGIKSSYGLQKRLNVAPTVAVNLWNDDVTRFSVETLQLLCEKLLCDVGDLLVYVPNARRKPVAANPAEVRERLRTGASVVASNPADVLAQFKKGSSGKVKVEKPVKTESLPDEIFAPSNSASDNEFSFSVGKIVSGESSAGSSVGEYNLTTKDAGELLNLSPRTVRENAEKGLLKGKQGKQSHWFFRRSDIDNFIAQRGKE
jgi:DNA-binding Xre family transcriptional regulator